MAGLTVDRRVLLAGGAIIALLAALALILVFLLRDDPPLVETSGVGLVVQTGRADDVKLDPAHPLRCFVDGKAVGELPLRECANRNGVATGALDVGLDPSGALAAASGPTSQVTPLPPQGQAAADAVTPEAAAAQAPARPVSDYDSAPCWRYGDGGWERLPDDIPLQACVRALFAGQCEPPDEVAYGRWGTRTLRLAGGAVQVSLDNRNFKVLLNQTASCGIAGAGQ